MSTHTPGPWEAVDSLTVRGPFAFGDRDKPGVQVCSLTHYVPATERAANARLIAMAPTMLDVLTSVRALLARCGPNLAGVEQECCGCYVSSGHPEEPPECCARPIDLSDHVAEELGLIDAVLAKVRAERHEGLREGRG